MIKWISTDTQLPPLDTTVWVCVRNKNKQDGIWLYDVCSHDGKSWCKRLNTWETIIYWAIPLSPDYKVKKEKKK